MGDTKGGIGIRGGTDKKGGGLGAWGGEYGNTNKQASWNRIDQPHNKPDTELFCHKSKSTI